MKFSLNPIAAQKMASLQKTVRRLIIILLRLFFLIIIRTSIWSPYGKNLADPVRTKTKTNICKVLSHASQSSHSPSFLVPFIKPTVWNSYFQILVEPHYEGNDDQFAKYCQTPQNMRFKKVFCC